MTKRIALVLGANGAIGSAIAGQFKEEGYEVWSTSRLESDLQSHCLQIIGEREKDIEELIHSPLFDSIVWAQGVNRNDSIIDVDLDSFYSVVAANTAFVVSTLNSLVSVGRLAPNARLCIISSIWQNVMRTNKLSYSVSKAAVGAVVKSCAADLGKLGFLINCILPGVLETPMTRSVLSSEQITNVENATGFGRLVTLQEVAKAVSFLCSPHNTAISGQSITVDLGFSNVVPV